MLDFDFTFLSFAMRQVWERLSSSSSVMLLQILGEEDTLRTAMVAIFSSSSLEIS